MSAALPASMSQSAPPASESWFVQIIKILLYVAAFGCVQSFHPVATPVGFVAFAIAVIIATILAQQAYRAEMRSLAALVLGLGLGALFHFLSIWVRESTGVATALGVDGTIYVSDILELGLASLATLFLLRFFAKRYRVVAVLEILLVVAVASYTLVEHRGLQINRPYWFADTIFALGWDPVVFLKAAGVALMVLGLLMALRRPGAGKAWLSFALAIIVGVGVFKILNDRDPPKPEEDPPTSDLLPDKSPEKRPGSPSEGEDEANGGGGGGKDDDDDSEGGGGGGGQGDGDGQGGGGGNSNSPFGKSGRRPPPNPVALVTFHDDYEPKEPVLYFRQQVLSRFDQTHLNADTSGKFDRDVLDKFPTAAEVVAESPPDSSFHKLVPTSMFLISDHPQPVALSHASSLAPLDNPNPNLFVAAYSVTSMVLDSDMQRLVGRKSVPAAWDDETKAHYTQYPNDPRYLALSEEIMRDLDPRFRDDDLIRAIMVKRYLEKNGFYTLKETHKDATDPTASFLFGSMRGYCVHFAHSAVFLMRSQGIAARVAVGYGVDTARRGSGSSMLILGNMAHAWPEIYLEGVGWVTFDVYPEQSDEPPQEIVDQDLASMLGEIARNDPTGGMSGTGKKTPFPWDIILIVLAILSGAIVFSAYAIKFGRRWLPVLAGAPSTHRWAMRAALDRLADVGVVRQPGETREAFADRIAPLTPNLRPLTMTHYRAALGAGRPADVAADAKRQLNAVRQDLGRSLPWWKRLGAHLNPIGWWLAR